MPLNKSQSNTAARSSAKTRSKKLRAEAEERSNIAELDFTPFDINGTCPIPTRAQWLEAADTSLPYLRMGFVFMTMTKEELGRKVFEIDEDLFKSVLGTLSRERTKFRQMAELADAALARVMVAMEAYAAAHPEEGAANG